MLNVSYYPGCSLEGSAREYGEATESVCKLLDVHLHDLDDWNCCGASSAHVVKDALAVSLAARNLEIAEKANMDLVVPCAACYQRLKVAEKELLSGKPVEGLSEVYRGAIKVKHLMDYFWEDVGEKAISDRVKKPLKALNPVSYYGCLTVRPPGVTGARDHENPKSLDHILETLGANTRNWSYKTDCCGGSLILTMPDVAKKLIKKLLDMAQEAGADCIVTGCPMCFSNLDSWQKGLAEESGKEHLMPIFYVSELMGVAFGIPEAGKWLGRHIVDPRPLLREKGLI